MKAQSLQNNILLAEMSVVYVGSCTKQLASSQEGFLLLLCFLQQNVDTRHHVSHLLKIFFLVFALCIILFLCVMYR